MTKRLPIDIALQGGGAHGAFTWGVLDRLLEDDTIEIVGVSGASAGAMNAVALTQGLAEGGADAARALLETFWRRVADAAAFSPAQSPMERAWRRWGPGFSPGYVWMDALSRTLSPYQTNPLGLDPLRDIVAATFDFERINAARRPRLFQSATNVRTGRLKIFRQPEISVETTLASACLPTLYKAVEIDGEAFWDGGYMGNPPLMPLLNESPARDALLVSINPFSRPETPRTGAEIQNRLNEITFNAGLLHELRALGFLSQLIEQEDLDRAAFRDGRLHRISADEAMRALSVASKMNADYAFLRRLFALGRDIAGAWLDAHRDALGVRSTWLPVDLLDDARSPAHLR